MDRPTVLHVVRDWVRPSEGFVVDVVRSCTATRPVVVCQQRWASAPPRLPRTRVVELDRWVRRLPAPQQVRASKALALAVATAERAAVLHSHFGYAAPLTAAVARRLGRPWVVSLHGHDLLVQARDDAALGVIREATAVVVPSEFLAERARSAGVPADRVLVIPSGVDLAPLSWSPRAGSAAPLVTFAGRFVEKKGVFDAIEAMAVAQRAHPGLRCRLVGHGPLRAEVEQAIASSGLRAEVLDGAVAGAVRAALAETDLLVVPSRTAADGDSETLGLVGIEAQACGVPVLTTRHGGIPEAVHPRAGLLVPEGDPGALAAGLLELLAAPERWAAMGRAGRDHVASRFELGSRVADLEELYLDLAAGRPARPPLPVRSEPPTVSVVMVTHDRRELLTRALDALEAQTLPGDRRQVLVVDNASSDGSAELLRDRPGVTVLTEPVHVPVAAARNRAVALATGDVVAFTDDDCRPVETWLEALSAGFREGVDLVQGRTVADADRVRPLERTQWTPREFGLYETANVAYTAAALARVEGPFDLAFADRVAAVLGRRLARYPYGEDTELAWRLKHAGARSRFAVHAVVRHHVFPADPRYLLRRARIGAGLPLVIRAAPELRRSFLWGRVFLGRGQALLLVALGGVGSSAYSRWGAVLVVPYLWDLLRPGSRGRADRARALPVLVARDVITLGALVRGSVRTRTPVL